MEVGQPVEPPGLDIARVAEIVVTLGPGEPGRRGSGYRVRADVVLTAAHVVDGGSTVKARFDADRPGEWSTHALDVEAFPEIDVALLSIQPRDGEQLPGCAFGRVAERDAVIECSAVGFPRWKMREDRDQPLPDGSPSRYRDTCHIKGGVRVLSNRREGTLDINVEPPERDPDPSVSPWEGMSGTAVFCTGRIIGIISEHHRPDGLGRLAARRVDRWHEQLTADQAARIARLLRLPARWQDLQDVVPPSAGAPMHAIYTAQVRDIAPRDGPRDREEELADLVAFCAGNDAYEWWQGPPWAGKTALAAWYALHPPAGVRVVSFFITRQLTGQADSNAFTDALIEQLTVLAGEPAAVTASVSARDGLRRHLIEVTAARLSERGERLLIVVDGLDEDQGAVPGSRRPSIASLLPRHPPRGLHVLVTSREHPPLPADVPGDHPLLSCRQRTLRPSAHAQNIEKHAKSELLQRLGSGRRGRKVIGLIAAAGGGLTLGELAELTGLPPWKIDAHLGGVFGRSLRTRERYETDDRVYLFAHETLRVIADQMLGPELAQYREQIHAWADDYRGRGWPDDTPRYLLQPYARLLAATGDVGRLADLAVDPARHDSMLHRTDTDAAAFTEISTAQELLLARPDPDLPALALLAVERERLATRSVAIPFTLPAVWARLGQTRHAVGLAHGIPGLPDQAVALVKLAHEIARTDPAGAAPLLDEAEHTVQAIENTDWIAPKAWAAAALAEELAASGLTRRAEHVANSISDPEERECIRANIAIGLAVSGRWELAERIASSIQAGPTPFDERAGPIDTNQRGYGYFSHSQIIAEIAAAQAAGGLWDRAERTARTINGPAVQAHALTDLAARLGVTQPERAARLADDAAELTRRLDHPLSRATGLAHIGRTLAKSQPRLAAHLAQEAEDIAHAITDPPNRAIAIAHAAVARAVTGPPESADPISQSPADPWDQDASPGIMAEGLTQSGLWDHAERAARAISHPGYQADKLARLAGELAGVQPERAARLARDAERLARNTSRPWTVNIWARLSEGLALASQWDSAERAAEIIPVTAWEEKRDALVKLTHALIRAGQWDRAERAACAIENPNPIGYVPPPEEQVRALLDLVGTLRAAGLWERAQAVARTVSSRVRNSRALAEIAADVASAQPEFAARLARDAANVADDASAIARFLKGRSGHDLVRIVAALAATLPDEAVRLAGRIKQTVDTDTDLQTRSYGTYVAAAAFASAGMLHDAESTARSITDSDYQAQAFTSLADALAAAGSVQRAEQMAGEIADAGWRARALARIVLALARTHPLRAARIADEAAAIVTSMRNSWGTSWKVADAAAALAAAGMWDQAEAAASSIIGSVDDMRAFSSIIDALIAAEFTERAEQTARAIIYEETRADALARIAKALAKTRPHETSRIARDAELTARTITNAELQARTLADVAKALASKCDTSGHEELTAQVCHLLGSILVSQEWIMALPVLGQMRPEAVKSVYERLISDDNWHPGEIADGIYTFLLDATEGQDGTQPAG